MIPRKLHFIYISTPAKGGLPFYFCYWAAVRSAMRCNPGFEVNLWYEEEPRSPYFARLADMVKFHKVKPPEEVFGNPVPHYAHKADVLRLQILLQEGGIYLDLDTVTVRPFEPLLNHDVVMSLVKNDGKVFGLGNSVIMASPGSSFLKRWYESYRTFRSRGHDEFYDEHGAGYSYRLAREHPAEITLLDETAFLTPDMTPRGIASLFLSDADYPSAFCHHLWGKNAQDVIESLNEWNVGLYPGLYSRQVQAVIGDELQQLRETGSGCSPAAIVPVIPRYAVVHVSAVHEIQRRFTDTVVAAQANAEGRGMVTTARDADIANLWVLLNEWARLKVELPLEVWSLEGELSEDNQARLASVTPWIRLRIVPRNVGSAVLKSYALCYSPLKQMLWLDNDCVPIRDPAALFADPEFVAKGSLFWLDADGIRAADAFGPMAGIWKLYGIPYNDCPALSPKHFLVDKARCLAQLLLAMFVNRNHNLYESLCGEGAAETGSFRFAWQYLQFRRDGEIRTTGYLTNGDSRAFGIIPFEPERPACTTTEESQGRRRWRVYCDRSGQPMFNQAVVQSSAVGQGFDVEPNAKNAALYRNHLARL